MERNNKCIQPEYTATAVAVRFSALGDVAMTLPVLYSAAIQNPETRFIFLTRPLFKKFAINPPENLEIVGVDLDEKYKGVAGMFRLAKKITREYKADVLIDLHDVLRTKMLRTWVALAGTKVRVIDKGRTDKKNLTKAENKKFCQLKPMVRRYAETIESAGIEVGNNFRSVFDYVPADLSVFSSVTEPPKKNEIWIGIAPFAKHKGKIYPPEQMEMVIRKLLTNSAVRIFLFGGGPDETPVLTAWQERYPAVTSLADKKLGFAKELALMSCLKVMISMDSGNMHLASLAGVPVVSIWGATHPYAGFMGYGQKNENAVQVEMECRPCSVFGDKKCRFGNYKCMEQITPERIFEQVSKIIAN